MNPIEKNAIHLDAGEKAFFDDQLTLVKARTYDVIHKDLKALTLLPVSTEQDDAAEHIEYRSYDQVGMAKIVSDYANDFPRVDTLGTKKSVQVHSLGDSYGYSIQEIRRAARANFNLDARRAMAARRGIEEKQDRLAWFGDSKAGLNGFINAEGITEYVAGNNLAGTSKSWANKTADEKLADVVGILTAAPESTNGKEVPDTLILPLALYNDLAYTPYGDNRDKTLLTFIRENYPTLTRIDWVQDLVGAGASGTNRVMAYTRDPMKVEVQIPLRLEQLPPERKGMEYSVICHQRTGGTIVYYPQSVVFCDGL